MGHRAEPNTDRREGEDAQTAAIAAHGCFVDRDDIDTYPLGGITLSPRAVTALAALLSDADDLDSDDAPADQPQSQRPNT